jgi:hypothetical protein
MNIGMLWYDAPNSKKDNTVFDEPFNKRVGRAVDVYVRKYGRNPNTCYVNIKTNTEGAEVLVFKGFTVVITKNKNVAPMHFWVGCEKDVEADYHAIKNCEV